MFAIYNRNLLARKFEGVRVAGFERLRRRATTDVRVPLVLYANHSSAWDGLVPFQIVRAAGLDGFALMEETQLRGFTFLRKLGAFSVARDNPREALKSINYAADIIRGTNNVLLIFPQGVTLANDARPLKFYNGLARLIEQTGEADVCALALRYEFLEDWRPFALARVGMFERIKVDDNVDKAKLTQNLAATLTRTLDDLRNDVLQNNLTEYVEIVAPRRLAKKRS
ncbi:MAG: hypothetical protein NVSMB56_11620 [Pyrinomonadaceae bacterium]